MIVHLTIDDAPRVSSVDDLEALKIEAAPDLDVGTALGPLGAAEGDSHAWIRPEVLQELAAPLATSATWQDDFRAMIDFAKDHGWIDATTGAIRVHVEAPPSGG